jgi:hypothetical protein
MRIIAFVTDAAAQPLSWAAMVEPCEPDARLATMVTWC